MEKISRTLLVAYVVACIFIPGGARAAVPWALDLNLDFSTGDYGTGVTTDAWRVSVATSFFPSPRWDFGVEVPYIYQSSASSTQAGDVRFGTSKGLNAGSGGTGSGTGSDSGSGSGSGSGAGTGDSGGTGSGTGTGTGSGTGSGSGSGSGTLQPQATGGNGTGGDGGTGTGTGSALLDDAGDSASGLGDIVVTAGFLLVDGVDWGGRLRLFGEVKLPTADEDEGLGTGETDFTLGLGASQWLGDVQLFAEGARVFQGGDSSLGLRDFWTWEAGSGYLFGTGILTTVSLQGASSPADGAGDQGELRAGLQYWPEGNPGAGIYLGTGVTSESPDLVCGGSLFWDF